MADTIETSEGPLNIFVTRGGYVSIVQRLPNTPEFQSVPDFQAVDIPKENLDEVIAQLQALKA